MSHNDPAVMDDEHAQAVLDIHFSMTLGCTVADLHRPGWTIVPTRDEADPAALLFGERTLVSLLAPGTGGPGTTLADDLPADAGAALVASELRAPVAGLLGAYSPLRLFTSDGLQSLRQLIVKLAPESTPARDAAHTRIYYTTRTGHTPYSGHWQEWIEPLDEFSESEPLALRLLARYSGGVYVVRNAGAIAGYAGIRTHSPHVAEVSVQTSSPELRGRSLGRAVVSRATKAILGAGRVPMYRYNTANAAAARIATSLGYRFYADAFTYTTRL
ncbi:MAG: GNAT family N-acetyltransferase [Ktedonobacterales bacterium]